MTARDREKEGDTMFQLSVCAETLFRELPLAQRAKEIARAGFLVGFWAWQDRGLEAIAAHPATRWITAYKALCQVAELAEKYGVVYNLEQLNTKVDHAGYPLRYAEDVVRLLEQVGSPRIKLLLDIYHVQIEEGNVIQV